MQKELVGKIVKIYKDIETKRYYEGDGRIEEIIKQISNNLYFCNISFEDDYFSTIIDRNDIIY